MRSEDSRRPTAATLALLQIGLAEHEFLERLIDAGVPAGTAELLIAREWSILAGENDYTTDTFEQITGRPPRPVAEFLHEYRAEFV